MDTDVIMAPRPERMLAWMARTGYAARGAVYALIGALVLWSCLHGGIIRTPGSRGALATLAGAPLGQFLLYAIALGLVAYALWRLIQGIGDADRHGSDAKGLVIRGAFVASALIHLSLAWSSASMGLGGRGGNDGDQGWTAELMAEPWGRWLVALIGLAVIGTGVFNAIRGWKAKFMKRLRITREQLGPLCAACRFGLVARGVVLVIVGGLLLLAAWHHDASEARGLRGAFEEILQQPFGLFLLTAVGFGLIAFSVYSFIEARLRRIDVPELPG